VAPKRRREEKLLGWWQPVRGTPIIAKRFARPVRCSEGQGEAERQLSVNVEARGNQGRCLPSQKT